jgi:hypothetical protein
MAMFARRAALSHDLTCSISLHAAAKFLSSAKISAKDSAFLRNTHTTCSPVQLTVARRVHCDQARFVLPTRDGTVPELTHENVSCVRWLCISCVVSPEMVRAVAAFPILVQRNNAQY